MSLWLPSQKPVRGTQLNRAHPLARGLVGCWVMNEGSGNKIYDLSGNKNEGIFQANAPTWRNNGLYFDQSNQEYIVVTSPSIPAIGLEDYSLIIGIGEVPDDLGTTAGLVSFDAYNPSWQIMNDNKLKIYDAGNKSTSTGVVTSSTKSAGFVRRGTGEGETHYFLDGLYDSATRHADSIVKPSSVDIGWTHWLGEKMNGYMQYIYFYERALSNTEIAWLDREPYAMFEQPSRAKYFYVSAGGAIAPTAALYGPLVGPLGGPI